MDAVTNIETYRINREQEHDTPPEMFRRMAAYTLSLPQVLSYMAQPSPKGIEALYERYESLIDAEMIAADPRNMNTVFLFQRELHILERVVGVKVEVLQAIAHAYGSDGYPDEIENVHTLLARDYDESNASHYVPGIPEPPPPRPYNAA